MRAPAPAEDTRQRVLDAALKRTGFRQHALIEVLHAAQNSFGVSHTRTTVVCRRTAAVAAEHLLGLTQALYGHAPVSYLVLLPTENFDFGERLSPTTARAAERALRFLDRRLRVCCSQPGGGGA